jgi:hypothetical protein
LCSNLHALRVSHSSLLAVGRCLAGCGCTVLQGAQLRGVGRRAVRGGGTAHTVLLDFRKPFPPYHNKHVPLHRLSSIHLLSLFRRWWKL